MQTSMTELYYFEDRGQPRGAKAIRPARSSHHASRRRPNSIVHSHSPSLGPNTSCHDSKDRDYLWNEGNAFNGSPPFFSLLPSFTFPPHVSFLFLFRSFSLSLAWKDKNTLGTTLPHVCCCFFQLFNTPQTLLQNEHADWNIVMSLYVLESLLVLVLVVS